MANLANVDFYHGAVLSYLLTNNKEFSPSLFEDGNEKRVFHITTNQHGEYMLRIHHSTCNKDVKDNAQSWTFSLTPNVVAHLQQNKKANIRNVIALIMIEPTCLTSSKIIYFTDSHLEKKGIYSDKPHQTGFTVRKYDDKNDYLLFLDKTEENSVRVKSNLKLDY